MRQREAVPAVERPSAPRRCEHVELPRDDQGLADSLTSAFRVEALPDEMRKLLGRLR